MDIDKLKFAEARFLTHFPGGFQNPEMLAIGKKHKMDKMLEFASQSFSASALENIEQAASDMVKAVSRSSMVSMFEKPKFRDFVKHLNSDEREFLVLSLKEFLHGDQQAGFERLVDLLRTGKLAKWSLVTIIPAYYAPTEEVFVKPTTAKGVIEHFGVTGLVYKPAPTWDFYRAYRQLINTSKQQVAAELSPSNAAFTGFLMMAMKS